MNIERNCILFFDSRGIGDIIGDSKKRAVEALVTFQRL